MIQTGHEPIRPVSFASGAHVGVPVEVTSRSAILARMGADHFDRPDRPSFTLLMLVESGTGFHTIDFQQLKLAPGRMLRVNPHQVQSWDFSGDANITLIVSGTPQRSADPWVLDNEPARNLGVESLRIARSLIDGLRTEQARSQGEEVSANLMVRMFEALVALFERAGSGRGAHQLPAPYVAFRSAIEGAFTHTHSVNAIARSLGYSERTISRACLSVTGRTAKGELTDRLVLEAKRMLVHSDLPASSIGHALGFDEATNFHRFFRNQVGEPPGSFRQAPEHWPVGELRTPGADEPTAGHHRRAQ